MLLCVLWYINIPKECFSPLKHSTSAWARVREEDQEQDQKPRSRSRAGSLQKNFVFSQWLFVSKAPRCLCFIHQNSTGDGAYYTPEHFPPGNVGVCCQSPKSKSGLDSDEGAPSIPFHPRSSTEATGDVIEVVWHGWPASWPSVSNDPTTTEGRR